VLLQIMAMSLTLRPSSCSIIVLADDARWKSYKRHTIIVPQLFALYSEVSVKLNNILRKPCGLDGKFSFLPFWFGDWYQSVQPGYFDLPHWYEIRLKMPILSAATSRAWSVRKFKRTDFS
jgi:hypothetical protein